MNPKLFGSSLIECIPQDGPCPLGCEDCYYNLSLTDGSMEAPLIPTPVEAVGKIVRMNSGHDSNIQRQLVVDTAAQYEEAFFNTSIPELDFPRPVVLTINPRRQMVWTPRSLLDVPPNLMFVRLLTNFENLGRVRIAVESLSMLGITCVITFRRYSESSLIHPGYRDYYEKRKHFAHSWWQMIDDEKHKVMRSMNSRLVYACGSRCRDCHVCESTYWLTKRRMERCSS